MADSFRTNLQLKLLSGALCFCLGWLVRGEIEHFGGNFLATDTPPLNAADADPAARSSAARFRPSPFEGPNSPLRPAGDAMASRDLPPQDTVRQAAFSDVTDNRLPTRPDSTRSASTPFATAANPTLPDRDGPDADAVTEARADSGLRSLIQSHMPEASSDVVDVWVETLKGMSGPDAAFLLQQRQNSMPSMESFRMPDTMP